jgi:hypothetical protein
VPLQEFPTYAVDGRLTAIHAALSRAGMLLGDAGEVVRSAVVGTDGFV